jgi:pimeloyl-ACP methyl ester carboxylesterase
MASPKLSRFRSPAHQERFDAAYDATLAEWPPDTVTAAVMTTFGTTCVHACGPSSGLPVVLLHGVAVASPSWFATAAVLARRHRVVAIDTITDAGRSQPTAPIATAEALADWLDEVLADVAPDGAHLVGLSYGAWLVLNQTVRRPGRVASAVVVDPPLAFGLPPFRQNLGMIPDGVRAKLSSKDDAPVHRLLARMNGGAAPEQPVLDLSVAGLRCFRLVQPRPMRFTKDQLASIEAPVLVMIGDRSPVNVPEKVAAAATAIPNAVVEIVADAGHALPLESPDDFAARVERFIGG